MGEYEHQANHNTHDSHVNQLDYNNHIYLLLGIFPYYLKPQVENLKQQLVNVKHFSHLDLRLERKNTRFCCGCC